MTSGRWKGNVMCREEVGAAAQGNHGGSDIITVVVRVCTRVLWDTQTRRLRRVKRTNYHAGQNDY